MPRPSTRAARYIDVTWVWEDQHMTAEKKPWYKKIWIWGIVAAVIVLGGVGQALNGDEEATSEAQDAPQEAVSEPETPQEAPEETPEAEPEVEPEGPSDEERAQALEQAIKDNFGGQEFSDLYEQDPTLWGGYITAVTVDSANAFITLQVAPDDPNRDDLGERAAQALSTLLTGDAIDGINWIITQDATETVIAQEQPAR